MLFLLAALAPTTQAQGAAEWRNSSTAEQAQDAVAFAGLDQAIREDSPDVQSAVVVKAASSISSTATARLSTLTGIALGQGDLASLDKRVVSLVPEWAGLNPGPRAAAITVRHLLTMTAGLRGEGAGSASREPSRCVEAAYAW